MAVQRLDFRLLTYSSFPGSFTITRRAYWGGSRPVRWREEWAEIDKIKNHKIKQQGFVSPV